jgi:DNA mismatch repair ATPase MutL
LFLDILDEIDKVARIDKKELEEKFLSTIAFNVSNKESFNNSNEELDNLLQRLLSLQNPFTYANGKPIAIKITKSDLEKKFARRK